MGNSRQEKPRVARSLRAVVDAALAVADDVGLAGLTIRAVAKRVGAPPMSLYAHFANKEELLDLMYLEVSRRLYADTRHPSWQAEVFSVCHQVRRVLFEHPNWAPLLSRPAPPLAVPVRERLLALMISDGLSPGDAFVAFSNAALLSIGFALVESSLRDSEGRPSLVTRFDRLKKWSEEAKPGSDPATRKALSVTPRLDLSDNFAAAIKAFIAGVETAAKRR